MPVRGHTKQDPIFNLLVESVQHMKLTPLQKEFAKAVLRHAITYTCMKQAGLDLVKDKNKC